MALTRMIAIRSRNNGDEAEMLLFCRALAGNGNWMDEFGFMIISCFCFLCKEKRHPCGLIRKTIFLAIYALQFS
jgi:hypothetical protein